MIKFSKQKNKILFILFCTINIKALDQITLDSFKQFSTHTQSFIIYQWHLLIECHNAIIESSTKEQKEQAIYRFLSKHIPHDIYLDLKTYFDKIGFTQTVEPISNPTICGNIIREKYIKTYVDGPGNQITVETFF